MSTLRLVSVAKAAIRPHLRWATAACPKPRHSRYLSTLPQSSTFVEPKEMKLNPTPAFNDTRVAFGSKSTAELVRAGVSFGLCQIKPLVNHAEVLLRLSRRLFGDRTLDNVLKLTMFGHFCAGENEQEIQSVVQKMKANGIGSILDYAAEDDGQTSGDQKSANKSKHEALAEEVLAANEPNVRRFTYVDEPACDQHAESFLRSIRDSAAIQSDGYTAMKVSALVEPRLLARFSQAVVELQNFFTKLDTAGNGFVSRNEFKQGVDLFFDPEKDHYMRSVLNQVDLGADGMIDYVTWCMMLRPIDLPQVTAGRRQIGSLAMSTPSPEEVGMLQRLYERIRLVAQEAANHGVRLLVDAEQCLYQPAIDALVLDLQREFNDKNKTDIPIVYNTYQCYLKDATSRLTFDLDKAERMGYHFGAKLVRGAYMESERELSRKLGYPSPIHDTIDDTHQSYDEAVRMLLKESKRNGRKTTIELMLASHNQKSIYNAVSVMNDLGIDRRDRTICFAQLYGMMDHLTYGLGKESYRAFKYVPYGEVKLAMPYLIRRANENSAIAGGAGSELSMITSELRRRMLGEA